MAYKPDKHGRDHCPGGEDPIPCIGAIFQATRWNDDIEGIDTTNTNVDWDHWRNGNPSVYEPRIPPDNPDPVEGTDLIRLIRLKQPGRYTFSLRFNLDSDSDIDGVEIGLHDSDAPWGYGEYYHSGPVSPYNLGGWVSWTWTAIYPLMGTDTFWPDFELQTLAVYFTIAAISADLVTSSAALLEISYDPVSFPAGYHDFPF